MINYVVNSIATINFGCVTHLCVRFIIQLYATNVTQPNPCLMHIITNKKPQPVQLWFKYNKQ